MPWPGPSHRRWGEREHPASPHSRSHCPSPPQLGSHLLSSAETQAPETARCHPQTPGTSPSACQCLGGAGGPGGCKDNSPGPLELPLSSTHFRDAMPPPLCPALPEPTARSEAQSPSKLPSWVPQYLRPHRPRHPISSACRLRPCAFPETPPIPQPRQDPHAPPHASSAGPGVATKLVLRVPGSAGAAGREPSMEVPSCEPLRDRGSGARRRRCRAFWMAGGSAGRLASWWKTLRFRMMAYTRLELPAGRESLASGSPSPRPPPPPPQPARLPGRASTPGGGDTPKTGGQGGVGSWGYVPTVATPRCHLSGKELLRRAPL